MNGKKKWLIAAVLAVVVAVAAVGVIWSLIHYVVVDFHFYPKNQAVLDLRGQELSASSYDKLSAKLPGCRIRWSVPFQGTTYDDDTTALTVSTLSDADVAALDYFPELETLDAGTCTDYAQLQAFQARRPEVEVDYSIHIGGASFAPEATSITLSQFQEEELSALDYLPALQTVVAAGGEQEFASLQEYCHAQGLTFQVKLGGKTVDEDATDVRVTNISDGELGLLQLLPELETLHLIEPLATAENLLAAREANPQVDISWEREICGVTCTTEDAEIDLSQAESITLEEVEAGMAYFPDATQVFLGDCGLDNDDVAAFREKMREQYKVVWIVYCGEKLPTRTDATSFMPSRDGVGYFKDEWGYNLRYCEDMIAIDVGHMGVKDISFVAYMPNLKYLILAHTEVSDITPISNCKNLIFLELDWSPISDYTPLQGCTALEDLNIGKYGADVTPLFEMTWLKNVWCIFRPGAAGRLAAALPDTHVVGTGNATVSSGWRRLPNYYAMRDALNMYYMEW